MKKGPTIEFKKTKKNRRDYYEQLYANKSGCNGQIPRNMQLPKLTQEEIENQIDLHQEFESVIKKSCTKKIAASNGFTGDF